MDDDVTGHVPVTSGRVRSWPVLLLALPAFVAIWSGWVGLGRLTGFGPVDLLPGIWDRARIDSSITLPVGMEAYAAYALHVWLSAAAVSERARGYARWSAIGALALGASGQVAYHLMVAAGVTGAPWQITALVACLPVAVLGMGAALAHLVREGTGVSPVVEPAGAPVAGHAPITTDTDTGAPAERTGVPVSRHAPAVTAACTSTPRTVREHTSATPDTDTSDAVLADTLRASGTRTVRGAQAELHVGRARAYRVLALAWPDADTGAS